MDREKKNRAEPVERRASEKERYWDWKEGKEKKGGKAAEIFRQEEEKLSWGKEAGLLLTYDTPRPSDWMTGHLWLIFYPLQSYLFLKSWAVWKPVSLCTPAVSASTALVRGRYLFFLPLSPKKYFRENYCNTFNKEIRLAKWSAFR